MLRDSSGDVEKSRGTPMEMETNFTAVKMMMMIIIIIIIITVNLYRAFL